VSADVSEEGDDGLEDIEARLRSLAIRSAWRRRNERQFGIVVLDGDANAASHRLAEIVALRSKSRIGFSPYFGDLGDTAEYAALADVARATLDPGDSGVTRFDDRPLSAVVVANPEIAARAARGCDRTAVTARPRRTQRDPRDAARVARRRWFHSARRRALVLSSQHGSQPAAAHRIAHGSVARRTARVRGDMYGARGRHLLGDEAWSAT